MARRYWIQTADGAKRLCPPGAMRSQVEAAAAALANRLRQAVTVGYDTVKAPAKKRPRIRRAKANPSFTGEEWKITYATPHSGFGAAYADTEAEAKNMARVLRSSGYRIRAVVRTKAPKPGAVAPSWAGRFR